MQKIKIAIIGLGRIGFNYGKNKKLTHFYSSLNFPNFQIVSLVDKNLQIKKKLNRNFKKIFYQNIKNIPTQQSIDLAIISSPDDHHYKNIIDIAKFNPKIIIVEKPISRNLHQTQKIIKLSKKNKINFVVNYSRRFNDNYIKIRQQIKSNYFGKIKYVRMHYSRGLIHNSIHLIDISLWLFGKPLSCNFKNKKKSKSIDNDWSADIILDYGSFAVYILSCDVDKLGNEEIDILGERKRVFIDCEMNIKYFSIKSSKKFKSTNIFKKYKSKKINYDNNLTNMYTEALKIMRKKNFNLDETLLNSLYMNYLLNKNRFI